MDQNQPSWLTNLSAIAGVGLAIVREVRAPSPTPIPVGVTGVQVSSTGSGVSLTTSPAVLVAGVAALALVVWLATR